MQLHHHSTPFQRKTFPVSLVCNAITKAPNIGGLFRTGDAFGVENIIFCGTPIPLERRFKKTSRATEKYVSYDVRTNCFDVLSEFKEKGYHIIALEITSTSIPLHTYQFRDDRPIALVIGNENYGISEQNLALAHTVIHVSMFGNNSSMNVVQATNIALYEITKQFSIKHI